MLHYLVMNIFNSLKIKNTSNNVIQPCVISNITILSLYNLYFFFDIIQKNKILPCNNFFYTFYLSTATLKLIDKPKLLYNYMLYKYLSLLLQQYTGFPLTWSFINIHTSFDKSNFYKWWRKLYRKNLLGRLYTIRPIFYNWFIQLTYFKDPKNLIKVIKNSLFGIYLKRHKQIFYRVSKFFKIWYRLLAKDNDIKGYSLFFKGKLAKQGSVRKTIFFTKKGLTSFANKSLRVNIRSYQVWTVTGSVGAGINIFYKVYVYINLSIYS